MALDEIIKLGDPRLYEACEPVGKNELPQLQPYIDKMHRLLTEFRSVWKAGRAIAAPQTGVMKQLIYMHIDYPLIFINPVLENLSNETMELWDDCMSFPNLLVRVRRHKSCAIKYRDANWRLQVMNLSGELSELLQHEYDHLHGILATMRATDNKAFRWREKPE